MVQNFIMTTPRNLKPPYIQLTGTTDTDGLIVSGVSTFQSHAELGDNDELRIGDGDDLKLYHNGSDSYIVDGGTGGLNVQGSVVSIKNAAGNESMIVATQDQGVDLYFNDSKKAETGDYGFNVSGTIIICNKSNWCFHICW